MTKKKQETNPVTKTWIWLKGIESKALQNLRNVHSTKGMQKMVDRWLEVRSVDGDGDFNLAPNGELIFKSEVAHVRESIVCPSDTPVKIARIDRTKAPKAKTAKKHVWTPKSFMHNPRSTKAHLEQLLSATVSQLNDLGNENAKLKNQIDSLKKKGSK